MYSMKNVLFFLFPEAFTIRNKHGEILADQILETAYTAESNYPGRGYKFLKSFRDQEIRELYKNGFMA